MVKKAANEALEPFVSVIVPVYNDAGRIEKCIEALMNQTYPQNRYEILIVDNGSTDDTCSVIKKYPVKLLAEKEKQSSYAARNKGIKNAMGEVIAFTDSDCIPASNWIEKGVKNLLQTHNCGLVAGRINIFFRKPDKPNAVELYDSITNFKQKEDLEKRRFGSTANVFTFKSVFDKVGLFNDSLKSGGDNEWGRRVFSSGYSQIYADDVCVAHPARDSLSQLYKRYTRLTGGCYEQYCRGSLRIYIKELLKSIKSILGLSGRIILGIYPVETLKSAKMKVQFFLVYIYVQIISNFERTRLLLGGKPKR
ncbi:MAG: glycosyltransferase [Cytophagaceae bacterium]